MTLNLRLVQNALAAALLRLPDGALERLLRGGRIMLEEQRLDLRAHLLLQLMARAGYGPMNEMSVGQARALFDADPGPLGPPWRTVASVVDRLIESPQALVPVRLYVPSHAGSRRLPALVYYHGGGWTIGGIDSHDRLCRLLAAEAECTVVSVDYRLGPEHRFPAAVDDAYAALVWVARRADELGVDAARIAVGGDSAGGNLAAVSCQLARTRDDVTPCFQLLIYPVTDLRCDAPSYDTYGDGFYLTRDLMHWFRGHYLEGDAAIDDPRASPLRATELGGLPPALILTAGFDPLRDDGRAYAERLRSAGVDVAYRCHAGLIHGFAQLAGPIPAAHVALADAVGGLRLAFARL